MRPAAPIGLGGLLLTYLGAQVAGAVLTSLLATSLAGGSLARANLLTLQLGYALASLVLLGASAAALARVPGPRRPGMAWPGARWALGGVLAGLLLKLAGDGLAALEGRLTPVHGNNPLVIHPQAFAGGLPLAGLAASLVLFAPAAEELFFRGLVYGWLRARLGPWPSSLVSGLAFAAAHANLSLLAPLWLLGIGLAWLYERSGSLLTSVAAHCAVNAASLALTLVS